MTLEFSQHAQARVRQRGLCADDVEAIIQAGTSIDGDSVLLLDHDVEREVRKRKHEIAMLQRLRGCRVIMAEEKTVVTVYRPSRETEKRLLRGTYRHRPSGSTGARSTLTFEGGHDDVR